MTHPSSSARGKYSDADIRATKDIWWLREEIIRLRAQLATAREQGFLAAREKAAKECAAYAEHVGSGPWLVTARCLAEKIAALQPDDPREGEAT